MTQGRLRLAAVLVLLAVGGAAVWMAVARGSPFPPRTITMATGPDGGAYQVLGERYREVLRRSGVDLRVVPTAGGVENLARLRDESSGVSVAFLESGLTDQAASPDLVSLGTVSFEPLWFFLRGGTRHGDTPGNSRASASRSNPRGARLASWPAGCSRSTAWTRATSCCSGSHRSGAPRLFCGARSTAP